MAARNSILTPQWGEMFGVTHPTFALMFLCNVLYVTSFSERVWMRSERKRGSILLGIVANDPCLPDDIVLLSRSLALEQGMNDRICPSYE